MANSIIFHDEYSKLPSVAVTARMLGSTLYFTGKKCKRGHVCPRYASSGNCVDCIGEKRSRTIRAGFRTSKRSAENQERAEAAHDSGSMHYEAVNPCPHGHYTRFTTTNNCVGCAKENDKKRKGKGRWSRIKKLYGLSKEDFMSMLSGQGNACAICKSAISESKSHIDHCHSTNKVRALLCGKCNQALGLFDDDPQRIRSAADYIESHR